MDNTSIPEYHRTWFKCAINIPLRTIQRPFTKKPLVLASLFDSSTGKLIGYKFVRIYLISGESFCNRIRPIFMKDIVKDAAIYLAVIYGLAFFIFFAPTIVMKVLESVNI